MKEPLPVQRVERVERRDQDRAGLEVIRGMNHFGVAIVEEADGMGAGVRLKFTRSDVRQIARLENEGGVVGSDDAP